MEKCKREIFELKNGIFGFDDCVFRPTIQTSKINLSNITNNINPYIKSIQLVFNNNLKTIKNI